MAVKEDSIFQKILKKAKDKGVERESVDWFRKQAQKVRNLNGQTVITGNTQPFKRIEKISANSIGKMYMFMYDPKWKDTLPFYDIYPLIFPIEYYSDGFLGINFHYLPPFYRAKLMDALMNLMNNNKYNKTTKLKISYQILKASSRFRYFKPCVKRYLFSHVKTPFLYIAPDEWNIALLLPTQSFQKKSSAQVYKDSIRKINE